jgi:hypothetical protein
MLTRRELAVLTCSAVAPASLTASPGHCLVVRSARPTTANQPEEDQHFRAVFVDCSLRCVASCDIQEISKSPITGRQQQVSRAHQFRQDRYAARLVSGRMAKDLGTSNSNRRRHYQEDGIWLTRKPMLVVMRANETSPRSASTYLGYSFVSKQGI